MPCMLRFVRRSAVTRPFSTVSILIALCVLNAVAWSQPPSSSVPPNPAKARFWSPVTYPSGGCLPDALFFADVNSDGIGDLIVANASTTDSGCSEFFVVDGVVSVLLGNADGTFQPAVNYDSGGVWPTSVAVGDVDGDGRQDIVVLNCAPLHEGNDFCASIFQSQVGVLLGNGDGTFKPAVAYATGGYGLGIGEPEYGSVVLGDFNGDGHLDVAVSATCLPSDCPEGSVNIMLGKGDGSFEAPVSYDAGGTPVSVAVGDLNGDGKPDLVVADCLNDYNCTTSLRVLLGNGDGSFQRPVTYGTDQYFALGVAIGDINLDGHPDVVVSNRCGADFKGCLHGSVSVLLGNGDGTLQAPISYKSGGYHSYSAAIVDANLDGFPDLVVTNFTSIKGSGAGTLAVLLGNGDGTLLAATDASRYNAQPVAVITGDFNRDGRPDLAVAERCTDISCSSGGMSVSLNVTTVATTTAVTSTVNPSVVGQSVTFTANIGSATVRASVPDGGVVTFYDGATSIGSGTTSGNIATFTTSALSAKSHTIKAAYSGDSTYKSSSGTVKQVVDLYTTTTNLNPTPNPSNYRQTVTLSAQVTTAGSTLPTGNVTFKNGTTSLGTASLSASGIATLTTTKIPVGSNSLTATYDGDSLNGKSTSAVVTQVVNQAMISMTLTSSPNPSALGKSVTLKATLTSNGGLPGGSSNLVTFVSGGVTLGTKTISNGISILSTTALPQGSDIVTATYPGGADYSSATASVTQVVQ